MSYTKSVMIYCENNAPELALKHYLSGQNHTEVLRLSLKLKDWNALAVFLINLKNSSAWSSALEIDELPDFFSKVVEKANIFPGSESASCLIKVLAAKEDSKMLLDIMSAWLEQNEKLSLSRSLQTLYLINLIKVI